MVRKEDSRLRGKVLSRFIKFSRCFRITPGTTPKKANADGYRRLEADANVSHRPGGPNTCAILRKIEKIIFFAVMPIVHHRRPAYRRRCDKRH